MKNYISKLSVAALTATLLFGMAGCSSDSTSAAAVVEEEEVVSYAGSLTLDGSVDTSSLSAADQNEVRKRSRTSRVDERTDGEEFVKLYVVDVNGSYVDTGIVCEVNAGAYTCPNIAGDNEYIVRYVQDLGNGQILEMTSSISVEDTSPLPAATVVSPITTMVVETLVKAVQDAVEGLTADATLIAEIIESVKTAIVNTITTLIQTNVIQIPSLVVDGNFTEIEAAATVVEVDNNSLDNIASVVTTNEDVALNIEAVQSEAEADSFSALDDAAKLQAVFDAIGWKDDMPGWVLEMFTAEYNNVEANMTFGWILASNAPFAVDSAEIDSYVTDKLGVDAVTLAGIAATIAADINASLLDATETGIFYELKTQVNNYHTIKAKTTLTDADKEFMRNFPSVVGEIFPAAFALTMEPTTTMQNMAQMFLVLGFTDLYDGVVGDMIKEQLFTALAGTVTYEGEVERLVDELFDDMGGQFILEAYTIEDLAAYNNLYVGHSEAESQDLWDGMTQSTALRFTAMLSKMEWDLSETEEGMPAAEAANTTAVLTYPKADGTDGTVNLTFQEMHGHTFFGVMPMIENPDFNPGLPYSDTNMEWIVNPDTTQIISDFVTGEYSVTFTYNSETFTDVSSHYFIQDSSDYRAEMVSPEAQPQWQEDWNEWDMGALTAEQQTIIDEFQTAQNAYWLNGVQAFAPNVASSGVSTDTNDTLRGMVISWKAPDVSALDLPDNIEVAYNVNVRLFAPTDTNADGVANHEDCMADWQACNIDIYSSWNEDKRITSTSMTLPVDLALSDYDATTAVGSNYDLSVDVVFVNKDTGREVSRGGWTNAQFRVGETLALTGTELVTFNGDIEFSEWKIENSETTLDANMTVALYGETWSETVNADGYTTWDTNRTLIATGEVNATTNTFTVSADWNTIEPHIGMNKNIQIIGFDDANGDGEWQDWDSVDTTTSLSNGENSYWMHDSWMHIDSWGDTVIRTGSWNPETGEQSEESTRLVKDNNVTVDGMSIMIW